MHKKGFTLAEVLITLAIIGVVAALTIPSVVVNYQKTQVETQLKKIYSVLSNTTNAAIAEEGPLTGWDVYDYTATVPGTSMKGSEHFAKTYLMPYLKVSKVCGLSTSDVCTYSAKWMNGINLDVFGGASYYKFILNDGTNIALIAYNFIYTNNTKYMRAEIFIDLNGSKKPNTVGKDIHEFLYYVLQGDVPFGKFLPWGSGNSVQSLINDSTWGCNKTSSNKTEYCTAAIMKNGWKIPEGYPW